MGEIVFQGTTWITLPVLACVSSTIRLIGERYLLILERDGIVAPVWLGPQDAANIIGAMDSLRLCEAHRDPSGPYEAEQ